MKKETFRVVTRGANGQLRIKDYGSKENLLDMHTQIGVDDCSTDLDLRGLPVFRGLIGPMAEGKKVVRYETPDVFEALTKEWVAQPPERRRRRRRKQIEQEAAEMQNSQDASGGTQIRQDLDHQISEELSTHSAEQKTSELEL